MREIEEKGRTKCPLKMLTGRHLLGDGKVYFMGQAYFLTNFPAGKGPTSVGLFPSRFVPKNELAPSGKADCCRLPGRRILWESLLVFKPGTF